MKNKGIRGTSFLLIFICATVNCYVAQAEINYWGQLTFSRPTSLEATNITPTQESLPLGISPASLEASLKQKADEGFRSRILVSSVLGGLSLLFFSSPRVTTKNTGVLWVLCSLYQLFKPSQEEKKYSAYREGVDKYSDFIEKQKEKREEVSPARQKFYGSVEKQEKERQGFSFDLKGKSEGFSIDLGVGALAAYAYITYQRSLLRYTDETLEYYTIPIWIDGMLSFVVGTVAFSEIKEMIEDRLDKLSSK